MTYLMDEFSFHGCSPFGFGLMGFVLISWIAASSMMEIFRSCRRKLLSMQPSPANSSAKTRVSLISTSCWWAFTLKLQIADDTTSAV